MEGSANRRVYSTEWFRDCSLTCCSIVPYTKDTVDGVKHSAPRESQLNQRREIRGNWMGGGHVGGPFRVIKKGLVPSEGTAF